MYVSNENANTVSVIDGQTNTVIGRPIPVGVAPAGSAFNPDNGDVYVTNGESSTCLLRYRLCNRWQNQYCDW